MEHLCSIETAGTDEEDVPKSGLILLIAALKLLKYILRIDTYILTP